MSMIDMLYHNFCPLLSKEKLDFSERIMSKNFQTADPTLLRIQIRILNPMVTK